MEKKLSIIERYLIESLQKREKNASELVKDLNLNNTIILNTLNLLKEKKIVEFNGKAYCIKNRPKTSHLEFEYEIQEVMDSVVSNYFKGGKTKANTPKQELRLKKVWLTEEEKIIYNSIDQQMDKFVSSVMEERKRRPLSYYHEKTADQVLIYWGKSRYGDLLNNRMQSV